MNLRNALRSGARAISLAKPATPLVAYVVATPAAPFVRIDSGPNPVEISALIRYANPAATAGYILGVPAAAAAPIAAHAASTLAPRLQHGGWFEATLDEAVTAIDEAAFALTGELITHIDEAGLQAMAASKGAA